jgi:hypothetical protein
VSYLVLLFLIHHQHTKAPNLIVSQKKLYNNNNRPSRAASKQQPSSSRKKTKALPFHFISFNQSSETKQSSLFFVRGPSKFHNSSSICVCVCLLPRSLFFLAFTSKSLIFEQTNTSKVNQQHQPTTNQGNGKGNDKARKTKKKQSENNGSEDSTTTEQHSFN